MIIYEKKHLDVAFTPKELRGFTWKSIYNKRN